MAKDYVSETVPFMRKLRGGAPVMPQEGASAKGQPMAIYLKLELVFFCFLTDGFILPTLAERL